MIFKILSIASKVVLLPMPVETTKSARWRLTLSGVCRARIASSLSALMLGRAIALCRCTKPGALTTTTTSQRSSPPVSNNNGTSTTTTDARAAPAFRRNRLRARRTSGCRISSRIQSFESFANTSSPKAWRSIAPARITPGKAAETGPTAGPFCPKSRWTSASESKTGTRSRRNIPAASLLPIAMEPVRPRIKGPLRTTATPPRHELGVPR